MQSDSASHSYHQSAKEDDSGNSVLFIQYLNPGAYPPLEHASDALIESNVECTFLGAHFTSTAGLDLPQKAGRRVAMHPIRPSFKPGALRYLHFLVWATVLAVRFNKRWVYCSDARSTPIGLVLSYLGRRVIYHEHDAPAQLASTLGDRIMLACRRALVRRVHCVAPSDGRAQILHNLGAHYVHVVRNYPSRQEVKASESSPLPSAEKRRVLYQGSIVPDRLPLTLVHALALIPNEIRPKLEIVGYETQSGSGHVDALTERARELGIPEAIEYIGKLSREAMLRRGIGARAGLSFMPIVEGNVNMKTMAGASNKPFDYMCQGAVPVCSDLKEWRTFFGDHAVYCDPRSPKSIAEALVIAISRGGLGREHSESSRRALATSWNYEVEFDSVRKVITASIQK